MVSLAQFKLYRILKFWFPDMQMNSHPRFLHGLELDFYSRKNNFAIELQGPQHERFVRDIQNRKLDFKNLKLRDKEKTLLCKNYGLKLFHVKTGYKLDSLKNKLETYLGKKLRRVPLKILNATK